MFLYLNLKKKVNKNKKEYRYRLSFEGLEYCFITDLYL